MARRTVGGRTCRSSVKIASSLLSAARFSLSCRFEQPRAWPPLRRGGPGAERGREKGNKREREGAIASTGASILSHVVYCTRPRAAIGRLMDRHTKWRQSVSPFSCLYRCYLRRTRPTTVAGKTNCKGRRKGDRESASGQYTPRDDVQPVCSRCLSFNLLNL